MPQDSLASSDANDTQLATSADSTADSSTTAAPESASQAEAVPAGSETSAADSTSVDSQTLSGQTGLESGETTGVPQTAAKDPFEKRYKDTYAWANQVHQKNLDYERQLHQLQARIEAIQGQYAGINPDELSEWRKTKDLKPWDDTSPQHKDFLNLVAKAEFYEELMQGETDPAELQKMQQKMAKALGNDGLDMLAKWRADVRQQERERRLNPRAFYQKLIREQTQPVVRETLQSTNLQYQQALQGREDAQRWMANKEVATPQNIQAVLNLIQQGISFADAVKEVELEFYKKQVSQAQKAKASADEKERLLQGAAAGTVARNPSASKKLDVKQHLKDKGIKNSRDAIDEYFNLDQQGLL